MENLRPLVVDDFENILQEYVTKMPTFSPATAKIVKLAHTLNASPNEIVSAIRLDPVLTGKVLQLVNSAYFSLAQRVTSLNRAVVYLGINTIKNLALSTALMEAFETKNKAIKGLIQPVWRHSLAVAIAAKGLAKVRGVPPKEIEEFFIMGLLHDLGKITMMQAFFSHKLHNGQLSLEEERAQYSLDHCRVGASILTRWKFSEDLVQAVRGHHAPEGEHAHSHLLHLANALSYELNLNGEETTPRPHPLNPASWAVLGLKEEEVRKELESAPDQIRKAEVFLNIATSTDLVKETHED